MSTAGLRVAIIGAGPAGFYTAEHLYKHEELAVTIDMYDRLPTPYGLVRGGVAPDHQKIKSVTKAYDKVAGRDGFRYFGGVELGRHVTLAELDPFYDAIVVSVGAPSDRRMGIPGEDLPGSLSATDFVGWYNAHPDFSGLAVDLSMTDAVVVGNGNVAVDVARILATEPDVLATTDIADHALEVLRTSRIRTVTMLGRRGPAQAAFTPKEVRELGELAGVTLVVDPADLDIDPRSAELMDEDGRRVMEALEGVAGREPAPGERIIRLRFLTSPTALGGDGRVERVDVVRNELVEQDGALRARATGDADAIDAGLVLRAVGYLGEAVPGLPFDERRGVVPSDRGQVLDTVGGAPVYGRYVAGWIKRGPQGVIGTNKADAGETVAMLLDDFGAGRLPRASGTADEVASLVARRAPQHVSWAQWQAIDAAEVAAGAAAGRPRRKFADLAAMLAAAGRSADA